MHPNDIIEFDVAWVVEAADGWRTAPTTGSKMGQEEHWFEKENVIRISTNANGNKTVRIKRENFKTRDIDHSNFTIVKEGE